MKNKKFKIFLLSFLSVLLVSFCLGAFLLLLPKSDNLDNNGKVDVIFYDNNGNRLSSEKYKKGDEITFPTEWLDSHYKITGWQLLGKGSSVNQAVASFDCFYRAIIQEKSYVLSSLYTVQVGTPSDFVSDYSVTGESVFNCPEITEGRAVRIKGSYDDVITLNTAGVITVPELFLAFGRPECNYVRKGELTVYTDEDADYTLTIDLVTMRIRNASDLSLFSHVSNYPGYYVLVNNISNCSCDSLSEYCSGSNFRTNGFRGIFDGRGHVLKNISFGSNHVFSGLGENGIVEGLVIVDCGYFAVEAHYATVRNVVFKSSTGHFCDFMGDGTFFYNALICDTANSFTQIRGNDNNTVGSMTNVHDVVLLSPDTSISTIFAYHTSYNAINKGYVFHSVSEILSVDGYSEFMDLFGLSYNLSTGAVVYRDSILFYIS